MNPSAVIYDNLSGIARECLQIADEAVIKLAASEKQLAEVRSKNEELVLTKVAADGGDLDLSRVSSTVNRLVSTGFVKRSHRLDTIEGIRNAPRVELFAILEKLASIAICPVNALTEFVDGEEVEKEAGQLAEELSPLEALWNSAWKHAKRQA